MSSGIGAHGRNTRTLQTMFRIFEIRANLFSFFNNKEEIHTDLTTSEKLGVTFTFTFSKTVMVLD